MRTLRTPPAKAVAETVRYQTTSTLTGGPAAKPGDLRLLESDGLVYRMKADATDHKDTNSWELDNPVLPRQYASEAARLARTGFTPKVGETIGINGTSRRFEAAAAATDDRPLNRASIDLPSGDIAPLTYGPNRPMLGKSGVIHLQTRSDDTSTRWEIFEDTEHWTNTGSGQVIFTPNGGTDLEIYLTLEDVVDAPKWITDADTALEVIAEGNSFAAPAVEAKELLLEAARAENILEIVATGISIFPNGVLDFTALEVIDFSNAGLTGSCPYLGGLHSLRVLDVTGNPDFTLDSSCTADNDDLEVRNG